MRWIVVAGTPRELLRYRWRVDGAQWSEASFATALEQPLGNGPHVIEVMAVDLNGNSDPTPVRYDLEVDGVKPMIDFAEKPADTLDTRTAVVVASVTDNRTAPQNIAVRLVLERVDGPRPTTDREIDFTVGQTRFELKNLADGKYKVTITARDEAENLSKIAQTEFTVSAPDVPLQPDTPEQSGGCSAAPGADAPLGGVLLGLLGLFAVLRRRRR